MGGCSEVRQRAKEAMMGSQVLADPQTSSPKKKVSQTHWQAGEDGVGRWLKE